MKIESLSGDTFAVLEQSMRKRSTDSYPKQEKAVSAILEDVRTRGDAAVIDCEARFDHCALTPETLLVTDREIEEAYKEVDPDFVRVIRRAIERIRAFHEQQKQRSWFMTEDNGMVLGQRVLPLDRAGVYVPGGKAAYPSSVLMNLIPAKVAGVGRILMCTPPGRDGRVYPTTLVAAHEAGADAVYKAGGAQAIAAMAFGTETIPKVDKITGPGNIYVALAKRAVYGHVSIDSVAGPSEITVLADETADPRYVAAWRAAADKLLPTGVPFEINTGAITRFWRTTAYPTADMIAYIKEHGGRFVLSSDSHSDQTLCYGFEQYDNLGECLLKNVEDVL